MAPLRIKKKIPAITMTLDGLSETIAAAADAAAEKVLKQASIARVEVENELGKITRDRDVKLDALTDRIDQHATQARTALHDHTITEEQRFAAIEASTAETALAAAAHTVTLAAIAIDVKSLLDTRTFTRGMIKMLAILSAAIGSVVTVAVAFVTGLAKWHHP